MVLLVLGFFNVYAMRVNLSIAIVAMVNNTALDDGNGSDPSRTYVGPSALMLSDSFLPVSTTNNFSCTSETLTSVSNKSSTSDGPFVWDEPTQSFVLSSFFYGYILPQIPSGVFAQKYGGKWIFGLGILLTSISTVLAPLAAKINYSLFVASRIVAGLGEGVTFPVMAVMVSEWTPPTERSRTFAIISSGCTLGTVMSMFLTGFICEDLGWEGSFYMFGIFGAIWFIFWTSLAYDSPRCHPRITAAERDLIEVSLGKRSISSPLKLQNEVQNQHGPSGGQVLSDESEKIVESHQKVPWSSILKSGPVHGILIAHVTNSFAGYMLLTEAPTFTKQILHLSWTEVSFFSSTCYWFSFLLRSRDLFMSQ